MGIKIFCVGVTLLASATVANWKHKVQIAGVILMAVGSIIMVMDK